ncbi:Ankyrin repeat-containing protein ITN1, partial [Linum perenne]
PSLSQTYGPSNATPLVSAATRGHTDVVIELLSKDGSLLEISRSNGKNALHLAARQGHVEIVRALLMKDPQLAASFKIFFIFNAIALFTSLAVVVVQITLVRGETKAEKRVVEVINKLMWLASVCTSVAFMASSYIVVGRKHKWAAILITVVGGVIMAGVLGTMTYYVVKSKRIRSMRKKDKQARRSGSNSWHHSDYSNSEVERIYAL